MPPAEDHAIQELKTKLEAHVRRRLEQTQGGAPDAAKDAFSQQKSFAKTSAKFGEWLAARAKKLAQFPRSIWPWSRMQRELCGHLGDYVGKNRKAATQLADVVARLQKQNAELHARLIMLEERMQRSEKDNPAMISTLSAEVRALREKSGDGA
jgi:uncharacterized protein YhaN